MKRRYFVSTVIAGLLVTTILPIKAAAPDALAAPAPPSPGTVPGEQSMPDVPSDILLPPENFVVRSALQINLTRRFVRLPLHKGSYRGLTVWYVLTDVSDQALATKLGINFAPRLA